jgi:hypothetical protein
MRLAFLFLGLTAEIAAAQESRPVRPPVEIAVGIDKIWTYSYFGEVGIEGFFNPAVSIRTTVPFTPRYALEGIFAIERRTDRFRALTEMMYGVAVKRGARLPGRMAHGFATFGAVGIAYRETRHPRHVTLLDGNTSFFPQSTESGIVPPVGALLGGGAEWLVGPRAVLRMEAQVAMLLYLPVGVRTSASLAIPLGRN